MEMNQRITATVSPGTLERTVHDDAEELTKEQKEVPRCV